VSRRTAIKKLTKLYWPSRKCLPKRLMILAEPKKWRGTTKKNFWRFASDVCVPPFSKSFRRHVLHTSLVTCGSRCYMRFTITWSMQHCFRLMRFIVWLWFYVVFFIIL